MKERAKLKKQNKSKHVQQAAASKETTPVEAVEEKVEEVKIEKEEVKEAEKVADEEEDVLASGKTCKANLRMACAKRHPQEKLGWSPH